jgi:malonyl-CoA O-methyltransferase
MLRQAHGRAAPHFATADFLHRRLREELLTRLDYVQLEPATVLDLGAGQGGAFAALAGRYPRSRLIGLDHAPQMLLAASCDKALCICGDAVQLPLPDASVDLVFCNLLLAYCSDPVPVFGEVRRVLREPGALLFSTLGPDTLVELREAWAEADDYTHVVRFPDMHDLGDLVVRAGLAEPVLDREILRVSYSQLEGLRADLRATGAINRTAKRNHGLTGRRAVGRLRAALDRRRDADGRLPLTAELIFGQAWAGPMADGAEGSETSIPIGAIGRRRP